MRNRLVAIVCGIVALVAADAAGAAQEATATVASPEEAVRKAEVDWHAAILKHEMARMDEFLADGFFSVGGTEGKPLAVEPRAQWLKKVAAYRFAQTRRPMTVGEMLVHVYGDTAVVVMLYSQDAVLPGGRNVIGNFLVTDVWIKTSKGWRVAERHAGRQEKPPTASPPKSGGPATH